MGELLRDRTRRPARPASRADRLHEPREAANLRANRITEHARGERTVAARTLTVTDVTVVVLLDYETNGRRSLATAKGHVKAIQAALGATTKASEATTTVQGVQARWQRAGVTNATINRRCDFLRKGLRLMPRARRLPFVPYIPRLKEPKRRGRYIATADAQALRTHLPEYARDVFELALVLANRRGQLSMTQRRYVDLDRAVILWPPEECKADESHTVPLVDDALAIGERAMSNAVPWCPFLFHGPDCAPGRKPSKRYGCVGDFKKAWAAACKAAGLPIGRKAGGYVFHHRTRRRRTSGRTG